MKRSRIPGFFAALLCTFALVAVFAAPNAFTSTQAVVAASSGASGQAQDAVLASDGGEDSAVDDAGDASDAGAGSAGGAGDANKPAYVEGEVVVTFDGTESAAQSIADYPGVASVETVAEVGGQTIARVVLADADQTDAMENALASVEGVSATQKNFCYYLLDDGADEYDMDVAETATGETTTGTVVAQAATNDPACNDSTSSVNQYYLYNADVIDAWDYVTTDHAVTVAVLDTGCNLKHADLVNNLNTDLAWDAQTNQALANESLSNNGDPNGHGTHVCGIVAAQANNSLGIAGASYNAEVIPVRTLTASGSCTSTVIARALAYVESLIADGKVDNLRVVNMSFGGYWESYPADDKAVHDAVTEITNDYGVLCVCAGGNGDGVSTPKTEKIMPGDYDECISVTCLNRDGTNTAYSDYNEYKDISAPGYGVYSTASNGGYATKNGTSMASPLVAGIVALEFAADPTLSVEDAREALLSTATELPYDAVRDGKTGSVGCVNAEAAVRAVIGAFEATASTSEVAQGEDAQFTVTLTKDDGLEADVSACTFQWQYSTNGTTWKNSPAEGNQTATLIVPATAWRLSGGYQYRCIVIGSNGYRVVSNTIGFDVRLVAAASTATVDLGAKGALACTVTGLGKATAAYQWEWSKDGGSTWQNATATGNATKKLSATVTTARAGYVYRCRVEASDGRTAVTDPIMFSVNPCAIASTKAVAAGATAKFTCAVYGADATGCSYQWFYTVDGVTWKNSPATGNATATLKVPATAWRLAQGNAYRCVVTLANGDTLTTDTITFDIAA